jgi:hypothetical protein
LPVSAGYRLKALQQGDLVSSEPLTEPCEQRQAVLLTGLARWQSNLMPEQKS